MAYTVMAYTGMALTVMAYTVMAYVAMALEQVMEKAASPKHEPNLCLACMPPHARSYTKFDVVPYDARSATHTLFVPFVSWPILDIRAAAAHSICYILVL